MFAVCDKEYDALIYDEFHLQVAEGDLHAPSRVDIARAVRNEAVRYVGHADLQRLAVLSGTQEAEPTRNPEPTHCGFCSACSQTA